MIFEIATGIWFLLTFVIMALAIMTDVSPSTPNWSFDRLMALMVNVGILVALPVIGVTFIVHAITG